VETGRYASLGVMAVVEKIDQDRHLPLERMHTGQYLESALITE
jgi:Ser-tRNA(Ala) deacylase AlaX